MKKYLVLMFCLVFVFSVYSCNKSGKNLPSKKPLVTDKHSNNDDGAQDQQQGSPANVAEEKFLVFNVGNTLRVENVEKADGTIAITFSNTSTSDTKVVSVPILDNFTNKTSKNGVIFGVIGGEQLIAYAVNHRDSIVLCITAGVSDSQKDVLNTKWAVKKFEEDDTWTNFQAITKNDGSSRQNFFMSAEIGVGNNADCNYQFKNIATCP